MKIRVRHRFKYTWDNITTHVLERGEYEVPRNVDKRTAQLAIQFGNAVLVPEPKPEPKSEPEPKAAKKKAPENKAVSAPENKSEAE